MKRIPEIDVNYIKDNKKPIFHLIIQAIVLHVSQSKSIYSQKRKLSFIAMNSGARRKTRNGT
jgi:hypothetical protein